MKNSYETFIDVKTKFSWDEVNIRDQYGFLIWKWGKRVGKRLWSHH